MKHPEIILLPILMISDYLLTVLGAIQRERKYNDHFKTQHYELNPMWQKSITQKRWFNPRHILLTALVCGALVCVLEFGHTPEPFAEAVLGCFFVAFGMILGAHFSNILMFRRMARRPREISGQVIMAHSLSLSISAYHYLMVAIPVAIMAIFSPTPFVLGGLAGVGLIFVYHISWIQQYRKKASKKADAGDQE
jgi:hypothetical protein